MPSAPLDLESRVHQGIGYTPGPKGRAIVRSQAEWARAWNALADTAALPTVDLRDSLLVIVASEEFTSGPFSVEIEGVRRCLRSGDLVVLVRQHGRDAGHDYGDRSIRAVMLATSVAGNGAVRFVDLPPVVDQSF